MARVVQRRPSPPYLLIIFVFLFLVSTVLLVLQYMENEDNVRRATNAQRKLDAFASQRELESGLVQQTIDSYLSGREAMAQTVVGKLSADIQELNHLVTGFTNKTLADSKAAAEKAYQATGTRRGLAVEAVEWHDQFVQEQARTKELTGQVASVRTELGRKDQEIASQRDDFQGKLDALGEKIKELDAKSGQRETAHQDALRKAQEEWNSVRAELDKNIAGKTKSIEELQLEIQRREFQIDELKKTIKDLRKPVGTEMIAAVQPDGKILRVLDMQNLVNISIGSNDRVVPGLTFTVYPQSGIPEDGKGKASIEVLSVSPNSSECRITQQEKDNPILPEDLVANLAFDSRRTYSFVVEGDFDLYGTGKPRAEGADEVKALIRRFGGAIGPEVDVKTDFVVMGEEPARPPKPADDAPPEVKQVWRKQMEQYDRYRTVKLAAQTIGIPVLNVNRFLAFIGYMPTQTLKS